MDSVYPWDREGQALVVDVGGGVGGATLPILQAFPELRLHVQDLPDSESGFAELFNKSLPGAIESGRVSFSAHDFFTPQPLKHADIYFLRHVIHDWADAEARVILSHIRDAMDVSCKLLIGEHVVFPTYREDKEGDEYEAPEPLLANWGDAKTSRLDLQVLGCLNAKQRTRGEFEELLGSVGLWVESVWRNMGDLAVVECRLK